MPRKYIFYTIFFGVLLLIFFGALSAVIPGFTKTQLPPISKVKPFAFRNQDGQVVTDKDVLGKVTAVNFFFTTCRSVCPRMNNNLRPVYEQFRNEPGFLILSYTSDPKTDSSARLKHYADSMQIDTHKWIFLTGRKDSLYSMARHSYAVDDPKNFVDSGDVDFLHTQFIALVNRKGEVVQIYDGIKPSEMKEMATRITELLKE